MKENRIKEQLKEAIINNNVDLLKTLLLNKDIDLSFGEKNVGYGTQNALFLAINNNSVDVIKVLLNDNRIVPNMNNNLALRTCMSRGLYEAFELLFNEPRFDITINNELLLMAVRKRKVELVDLILMDERTDPNCNSRFCLTMSLLLGDKELVKLFLNNSKVDFYGLKKEDFLKKCEVNCMEIMRLISSEICSEERTVLNYLLYAIEGGDLEVVKFLFELLTDVETKKDNAFIMLNNAALFGFVDIAMFLIESIEVKKRDKAEAIVTAYEEGKFGVVDLLWRDSSVKDALKIVGLDVYNELKKRDITINIDGF